MKFQTFLSKNFQAQTAYRHNENAFNSSLGEFQSFSIWLSSQLERCTAVRSQRTYNFVVSDRFKNLMPENVQCPKVKQKIYALPRNSGQENTISISFVKKSFGAFSSAQKLSSADSISKWCVVCAGERESLTWKFKYCNINLIVIEWMQMKRNF